MAAKASSDQEIIADINIVPLVDIILVVLIIFMVTATTFSGKEVEVELPKASTGGDASAVPLTVQVNSTGRFFLDGNEVDESTLRLEAEKRSALNPESQAVISADVSASHGSVVRALDAVKSGGIAKLAVSVEGEAQ
ncbi:MAG: biopolymer transporter ExbD [Bdellovibrionales bacterium]|nr:biopolymer transporter ExbD [Bdellovibrionales bacterium]